MITIQELINFLQKLQEQTGNIITMEMVKTRLQALEDKMDSLDSDLDDIKERLDNASVDISI